VITPFGLHHIRLVRDLQKASSILDFKSALLELETPLRIALRGYFLRSHSGVFTYVLRAPDHGKSLRGFAQARTQKPRSAWSTVCMAPTLDSSKDAATIWYRLLLHLCIAAGERRVQRLLARLSEGGAAEEVFRQAGFSVYCRERVFQRLSAGEVGKGSSDMRPLGPTDLVHVQRLLRKSTPRLVLLAEGVSDCAAGSSPLKIPSSETERYYGVFDDKDRMRGTAHVLLGPYGSWLRLMVHPDARESAAEMLDHAVAVLNDYSPRPIYCTVRDYQGGVQAALEERGFTLTETHCLLVKHTTVLVSEPSRKLIPALEKRAEVAPTVSRSEAEVKIH